MEDQNISPDAGDFNMSDFLEGTSPEGESTPQTSGQEGFEQGAGGTEAQRQAFRFGGRDYKSQQEAEKAHGKLYGQFSEQRGQINKLKEALSGANPELLQTLMQDENLRNAFSKFGLSEVQREVREDAARQPDAGFDWNQVPAPMKEMYQEMRVEQAGNQLDRELWGFERQLGKQLTKDEQGAVMQLIERAPNLSIEEAYKLAFYDKAIADAAKSAQAQGARQTAKARPRPAALGVPGVPLNTKKPIEQMTKDEWRENLRNSEDLQRLIGP